MSFNSFFVLFCRSLSSSKINIQRLISFFPIFIGFFIFFVCFWLLQFSTPAYAWPDELVESWVSDETDNTFSLDWADWDLDGDLDLIVGNLGDANRVYQNDNGRFTLVWSSPEIDDTFSVAWGDLNNDNYPDVVVGNGSNQSRIYTNTANIDGSRTLLLAWTQPLADNRWTESVDVGDWDKNNFADIVLGNSLGGSNQIYTNTNGAFQLAWSSIEINGTKSVAFGDMNNDGFLDLAVGNYWGQQNQVYTNTTDINGNRTLALAWTSPVSDSTWDVDWGDWNDDGFLDLAVANNASSKVNPPEHNHVYLNVDQNNQRTLELGWSSPEGDDSYSIQWGDWDGDGDEDLAVGNVTWPSGQPMNRIYENNVDAINGRSLDLIWSSYEKDDTQSVAWADVDLDGDLDIAFGNQHQPNKIYINSGGNFTLASSVTEPDSSADADWGDVDGDGYLDVVVANDNGPVRVYKNDGLNLTLIWSSDEVTQGRAVDWGDWDNDGDLDIVVGNYQGSTHIYTNHLNENSPDLFSLAWASTEVDRTYSLAWGDWDNDDDLDLITSNFLQPNRIYENRTDNQGNHYMELVWSSPETDFSRSVAWADCNEDGFLDIAVGNAYDAANAPFGSRIYVNTPAPGNQRTLVVAHTFAETDSTMSAVWGDWNGDGHVDLALGNADPAPNTIYNNDGNCNFSLGWTSTESTATRGLAFGDWDGDGDLDLAASNVSSPNQIYMNNGSTLALSWQTEETDNTHSIDWVDVDNDGDLDFSVANLSETPNRIYRNNGRNLPLYWSAPDQENSEFTKDIAWGDFDNDGDLDFAISRMVNASEGLPARIYENDNGHFIKVWESNSNLVGFSLAWGDADNDGDLDLAIGNYRQQNHLYRNDNGAFTGDPVWVSNLNAPTRSIAWADFDGDGDLDLGVGNGCRFQPYLCYQNELYENINGSLSTTPIWNAPEIDDTYDIAWVDWDNDGDLDFTAGNYLKPNRVYQNDSGILNLVWSSNELDSTFAISWADWNQDGRIDMAVGNINNQPNRVYENMGGNLVPIWQSPETDATYSIDWGDWDNDGDPDLLVGNHKGRNRIYTNRNQDLQLSWSSPELENTHDIAFGDMDHDGDLDIAVGNEARPDRIYQNRVADRLNLAGNSNWAKIEQPGDIIANQYAAGQLFDDPTLPISYTLYGTDTQLVSEVKGYYSLDGGSQWHSATPASGTITQNLTTSSSGTQHIFIWDIANSGFFGSSDSVIFRLDVSQPSNKSTSSPYITRRAQTNWFRVRGTQIYVTDGVNPISNATVYRQSDTVSSRFIPYQNSSGLQYRTNAAGYLVGRGVLEDGDRLTALAPVNTENNFTLYHTNAIPNETGFDTFVVTEAGVQTLTVSADNPLILFDLDITLEWDGRNDPAYIEQLSNDLQRTSQIFYDLTDGQMALGDINIYHNKENWLKSHILIQASNTVRPNANLGGNVDEPTPDLIFGEIISDAYLPGQIRMGATWNQLGNATGNLGEDWPRALAHELGHYLLFLPDNYLGLTEDDTLVQVDCQGSAMTDAYREDYSELLPPSEWVNECTSTMAEKTTGRADWETIIAFYSELSSENNNDGPSNLPLNVTNIEVFEPTDESNTLDNPLITIVDHNNQPIPIPAGQGKGYIIQTKGTATLSDDTLMPIGSPNADLILARGIDEGDRFCVFDYSQETRRLGCLEDTQQSSDVITLHDAPNWQPQITVHSVNSLTLQITVNQSDLSENLFVQVYPSHPNADNDPIISPHLIMAEVDDGVYTQIITFEDPIFHGHIRVWTDGSEPSQEEIVEFFNSSDWLAGNRFGWGAGNRFGWGAGNRFGWGAPIRSSDGQVVIFDLENIIGGDQSVYTLQSLSSMSTLPSWLTPVGQAYRYTTQNITSTDATIMFQYLEREVPGAQEEFLQIFYSSDEGTSWTPLESEMDTRLNLASAPMAGDGIYILVATIEMPPLVTGWNNFGFPVPGSQEITKALASIDGMYSSVYEFTNNQWFLYDADVSENHPKLANFVNDLTKLQFGHAYWLYATTDTSLYLPIGTSDMQAQNLKILSLSNIQLPPATFYGWVNPTSDFTPVEGMIVSAWIDDQLCGQGKIERVNGRLAYKVQVKAEPIMSASKTCGHLGEPIQFRIDQHLMGMAIWDNSQAHYLSFGLNYIFLPTVMK